MKLTIEEVNLNEFKYLIIPPLLNGHFPSKYNRVPVVGENLRHHLPARCWFHPKVQFFVVFVPGVHQTFACIVFSWPRKIREVS